MSRLARAFATGIGLAIAALSATAGWILAHADAAAPGRADAAIVLGAAVVGDTPSPVYAARLDHAVEMYHVDRVGTLIFTGGTGPGDTSSEGEAGRAWAVARGVPVGDTLVETTSRITEENLRNARDVAHAAGLRTFLVVSDPLHLPRAVRIARDLGLDAAPAPTPYTRYRTWRTRAPFLAREAWFLLGYELGRPFRRDLVGRSG